MNSADQMLSQSAQNSSSVNESPIKKKQDGDGKLAVKAEGSGGDQSSSANNIQSQSGGHPSRSKRQRKTNINYAHLDKNGHSPEEVIEAENDQ